jgi:hypothetical protein
MLTPVKLTISHVANYICSLQSASEVLTILRTLMCSLFVSRNFKLRQNALGKYKDI